MIRVAGRILLLQFSEATYGWPRVCIEAGISFPLVMRRSCVGQARYLTICGRDSSIVAPRRTATHRPNPYRGILLHKNIWQAGPAKSLLKLGLMADRLLANFTL